MRIDVHVIDTPGLGDTLWRDETRFGFAQQAETLKALLEKLGLKACAVLGHDTGATLARRLAIITSRGVATWLDTSAQADGVCRRSVFVATVDARLIALDAAGCGDDGLDDGPLVVGLPVGHDEDRLRLRVAASLAIEIRIERVLQDACVGAGIQAVSRGQVNAARAIGMNEIQVMRLVIAPQAFRIIIPPLGNSVNGVLKTTSIAR